MTSVAASGTMTPEAFLAWEREQPERHTYYRGQVFAMAGGSPRHSRLSSRLIARLDAALSAGPCDVHTSDLKLGLDPSHFGYADAVVVCGPLELRPGTSDVVQNPTAVFEVLSRTTERYDRGEKQAAYLARSSLSHYVLVSQREVRVELYSRQGDGSFRYRVLSAGDTLALEPWGAIVTVDDLFAGAFTLPGDETETG